jgi:hypothetical protein
VTWFVDFSAAAARTDRLPGAPDHVRLLAAGLIGEAGSVLTELKKEKRERDAYPAYRHKMLEEIGDLLWYFSRVVASVDPDLAAMLNEHPEGNALQGDASLPLFLELGAAVGEILAVLQVEANPKSSEMRPLLVRLWQVLGGVSKVVNIELKVAADNNLRKIESRWPDKRIYAELFDNGFPVEDRLPRRLTFEFRERPQGERRVVLLRCNDINFGDRLTDNIEDPDGYRYHDVFHFAYAVHLGWSPVVRSLLRCKRKSNSTKDEGQDGARAIIVEEAVSAIVFSRAKRLNFFDEKKQVDYDLLKTVHEFVQGFEVDSVPLWQWEAAILDGYRVFRNLRNNRGGHVVMDLERHELQYRAP